MTAAPQPAPHRGIPKLILPEPHQGLLDRFCAFVQIDGRTADTALCWRSKLRPLLRHFADKGLQPADWTQAEFEAWLTAKKAAGFSTRSVQLLIDACRLFMRWADERKLGIPTFCALKKPKYMEKEARWYSQEEANAILDAAANNRFSLCFALAVGCGMRKREILNATWESIRWSDKPCPTILVIGSKTHSTRRVPIMGRVAEIIGLYRQEKGRLVSRSQIINLYMNLRRFCAKAGVEYKPPHSARHGFVSNVLANGGDVGSTARLVGHKSLRTTAKYAHADADRMMEVTMLALQPRKKA